MRYLFLAEDQHTVGYEDVRGNSLMWQNRKFILHVSYCMMLNTHLEGWNFAKTVQEDF